MLVSLSLPFVNLYLFEWYHTPAVVQHQKGPCLIHRAYGRCVCVSYTTVNTRNCCTFVSFIYLRLDQKPILYCEVSNTSVQHQKKGRCLIHRAHGRCVCASYTTVKPRNCCIFVSLIYLRLYQQPILDYIVWYQTPAVVQHQKGRCLISRAHDG